MKFNKLLMAMILAVPFLSVNYVNAQEIKKVEQSKEVAVNNSLNSQEMAGVRLMEKGDLDGALAAFEKAYLKKENVIEYDYGKMTVLGHIAKILTEDQTYSLATQEKDRDFWYKQIVLEDEFLPVYGEKIADAFMSNNRGVNRDYEFALDLYAEVHASDVSPEVINSLRKKIVLGHQGKNLTTSDMEIFNYGWLLKDDKDVQIFVEKTRSYKVFTSAVEMLKSKEISKQRVGRNILEEEYMRGSYPAATYVAFSFLTGIAGGVADSAHSVRTLSDLQLINYNDVSLGYAMVAMNGLGMDKDLVLAKDLIDSVDVEAQGMKSLEKQFILTSLKGDLAFLSNKNADALKFYAEADKIAAKMKEDDVRGIKVAYAYAGSHKRAASVKKT